jgi:hypothetical protein
MWLATRSELIFCSPTAGRTGVLSIGRDAGCAHGSVRILSQFAWVLIPTMAGVPIVGKGEAAMGRAGAGAVPSPLPRSTVFPASFAIPWPADRSLRGPAAQPRQRGQDALIRRVARYGLGRMGASAIPFTGQHAPAGPGAAPPLPALSLLSGTILSGTILSGLSGAPSGARQSPVTAAATSGTWTCWRLHCSCGTP